MTPQPDARSTGSRSAGAPASEDAEARAWGWVAHLRAGGTTPWLAWDGSAPARQRSGPFLPGAQQLELLRRLNLTHPPTPATAGRVLTASAPGRGRPDLELVGVLVGSAFGPDPVDPATLPEDELVRVATMLIAEDVVTAGEPAATVRRTRRLRITRRPYRILGDPELAEPARAALIAEGRPPGGRSAEVVVLGTDTATMLADTWTARCLGGGAAAWPAWCAAHVRRGALPARIDLASVADHWARRVGHQRLHVVLDPAATASVVRGRRALAGVTRRRELSADAVELARRTAPVLGLLVTPDVRARLMDTVLRARLEAFPGPSVVPAPQHLAWLDTRAADLRRRIVAADYAVHGDLAGLLPRPRPGVEAPSDEGVLELAMRMLTEPSDRPEPQEVR